MLPSFGRPVWWRLGDLPDREDVIPLLELEAAEFTAVLGQPVHIIRDDSDRDTDVWDVCIDPSAASATLESDLQLRRLRLTLPAPSAFADGVNLLHSLAFADATQVSDTETNTYAEAFDRIRTEVANIYPYFELRGLDWDQICEDHRFVRDLEGVEFWHHASRWIAALGDAHTQLIRAASRHHPPYLVEMRPCDAVLRRVPEDSDAGRAGVRPGHMLVVDDPATWLSTVGASPQHHALVAGRRFLAMSGDTRDFTALTPEGDRRSWTEERRPRASVKAEENRIRIEAFTADVPERLRHELTRLRPEGEVVIDLRGNAGGSLVAAAEARRLFVRDEQPFGSVAFTTGRGALATPTELTTSPAPDAWRGTVRVLVDSMTYSSAEDFLHPLAGAPHVWIVGGPTGGGSGRPHTRLLKDGVRLAVSTAITYTRDHQPIEYHGIR